MKKLLPIVLLVVLCVSLSLGVLAGCETTKPVVGLIALHDSNSTYDKNFIDAFEAACQAKGLKKGEYVIVTNVPESEECYNKAAELADAGCKAVFADSFGHGSHILRAAQEFTDVQFCHATGTDAINNPNLTNFHNAFASIYEARYLAGVAAGLKLKEMIDTNTLPATSQMVDGNYKIGYVGAFTYAEVISGYTSFYLGVKSIVPNVTMEVTFTGSWYDEKAEKSAAETLIANGAALISQHADSMGAPTACDNAGVPNVCYNISTKTKCPNSYVIASRINWQPYFEIMIEGVLNGTEIPHDWVGTIATGSVEVMELGTAAAQGTQEKLDAVKKQLVDGTLHVFDTNNFTVKGEKLTSYTVHLGTENAPIDKEAINDGIFCESDLTNGLRSAPYFDIQIDGITLLNTDFGD